MKIHQKKLFLKGRNDSPKARLGGEGAGKQSDGGDSDMGHSAKISTPARSSSEQCALFSC